MNKVLPIGRMTGMKDGRGQCLTSINIRYTGRDSKNETQIPNEITI